MATPAGSLGLKTDAFVLVNERDLHPVPRNRKTCKKGNEDRKDGSGTFDSWQSQCGCAKLGETRRAEMLAEECSPTVYLFGNQYRCGT
jgi:hypothetical protein